MYKIYTTQAYADGWQHREQINQSTIDRWCDTWKYSYPKFITECHEVLEEYVKTNWRQPPGSTTPRYTLVRDDMFNFHVYDHQRDEIRARYQIEYEPD
jgi:hypothetical protein